MDGSDSPSPKQPFLVRIRIVLDFQYDYRHAATATVISIIMLIYSMIPNL